MKNLTITGSELCFSLLGNTLQNCSSCCIAISVVCLQDVLGRKPLRRTVSQGQRKSLSSFYRSEAMIPRCVNSDITRSTISGRTTCVEFGSGVLHVALQIICPSFLVAHTSIARMSTF